MTTDPYEELSSPDKKPRVLLSGYVRAANQSSKLMAEEHSPLKEVKLNDYGP